MRYIRKFKVNESSESIANGRNLFLYKFVDFLDFEEFADSNSDIMSNCKWDINPLLYSRTAESNFNDYKDSGVDIYVIIDKDKDKAYLFIVDHNEVIICYDQNDNPIRKNVIDTYLGMMNYKL